MDKGLQSAKAALTIARKEKKKAEEMDFRVLMAEFLLRLGEFKAAMNTLKQVREKDPHYLR